MRENEEKHSVIPCCPDLSVKPCCDRLDFRYRLLHRAAVTVDGRSTTVPVDVTIVARFERCPEDLVLGDPAYTTTLLPGESVRLFSSDRRSRFTYDKETGVSYRHAQATESQYYMSSIANSMSDLEISSGGSGSSRDWGDWGADMDSSYGSVIFAGGAQGSIDGEYDDQSTYDFSRNLSQHAESSHYRSEMGTQTTSAISIGEVQTRTHVESESETHFEAATRVFKNENRCHAVTYYFYRINRRQTVKFEIVSVERAVRDPAAPTVTNAIDRSKPTAVSALPMKVLGTASDRLEVEERARQSVRARSDAFDESKAGVASGVAGRAFSRTTQIDPLPQAVRLAAIKQVDDSLVKAGLLDKAGSSKVGKALAALAWKRQSCLPTPGLMVKGCLDDCDVCEPELHKSIELDLERKALENQLLAKQIELLEQSQEYRCCPTGEAEDEA